MVQWFSIAYSQRKSGHLYQFEVQWFIFAHFGPNRLYRAYHNFQWFDIVYFLWNNKCYYEIERFLLYILGWISNTRTIVRKICSLALISLQIASCSRSNVSFSDILLYIFTLRTKARTSLGFNDSLLLISGQIINIYTNLRFNDSF